MFFLLIACSQLERDSGVEEGCFSRNPSVTVGTGEQVFLDLEPEQKVTMVHGPQGGWHMLGSVRLEHTLSIVEIDFRITDILSGVVVSSNHYRVGLIMEDECTGFYPGMYGYLNVQDLIDGEKDTPPELLGDHLLKMEMETNDCTVSQDEQGICIRSERWAKGEFVVQAILDEVDR